MKTFSIIAKIVIALAAVAGIVFVVAKYGDKIVAWAKKLCAGKGCKCEDVVEEATEEAEEAVEEASEAGDVANEADFEA